MKKLALLTLLLVSCASFAYAVDEIIPPAYDVPEYVTYLLEVAREELGNGEDKNGVTKYGEWAGDPKAQWCAEFACWCVDQVDQRYTTQLLKTVYPLYSASNVGRSFFIKQGRYIARNGHMSEIEGGGYQWYKGENEYLKPASYIPQPGDWMFFTFTSGTDTDHVAIVEHCTVDAKGNVTVHVIEGNNPSKVSRNTYALTNKSILGYGTVHDLADWTLRYGDQGEKVRYIQLRLAYVGFFQEEITGLFDRKTIAAIDAFQSQCMPDKRTNGIADISTQNALNAMCLKKMKDDPSGYQVIDEDEGGL
jgi:Putative peptidoglycan-binding domain-containing protein